jgi:hypothetical protein
MKRVIASTTGGSRVVQVSLDVEIKDGRSADAFLERIEDEFVKDPNYRILGSTAETDLTAIYEKSYPELLELRN